MELQTPSQHLINLEKADLIGKTLVGHPADGGRPYTLGTVTGIRHHSQSTIIDLEKNGASTKIALDQTAWVTDEDKSLVNHESSRPMSEGQPPRTYVRLTTKPSMTAVQIP